MGKDVHEPCCHTCELYGSGDPPPVVVETPVLAAPEPKRLKILVSERGGCEIAYVPTSREVTIGRVSGNDLVLKDSALSRRQARFEFKDDQVILVDLKSACGTYVNGRKITSPVVLREDAVVNMGNFVLRVVTE